MARSRFSKAVKRARWLHAGGRCENPRCGRKVGIIRGDHQYDHYPIPAAWEGPATFENCRLLCYACHRLFTEQVDVPKIAKARRLAEASGVDPPRKDRKWRRPMDGSRDSNWRKPMRGPAVRRPRNGH